MFTTVHAKHVTYSVRESVCLCGREEERIVTEGEKSIHDGDDIAFGI